MLKMGIKNLEFGRGGDLNTIVGKGSAINGDGSSA